MKAQNTHEKQLGSWLNLCLWTLKQCKICCDQEIRSLKIAKTANFGHFARAIEGQNGLKIIDWLVCGLLSKCET